jgi:hypothetical protein
LGTEYPIAKQIGHLARDLLAISDSLTPMAVDYIFYQLGATTRPAARRGPLSSSESTLRSPPTAS